MYYGEYVHVHGVHRYTEVVPIAEIKVYLNKWLTRNFLRSRLRNCFGHSKKREAKVWLSTLGLGLWESRRTAADHGKNPCMTLSPSIKRPLSIGTQSTVLSSSVDRQIQKMNLGD